MLKGKLKIMTILVLMLTVAFMNFGCGALTPSSEKQEALSSEEVTIEGEEVPLANVPATPKFLVPTASGITVFKGGNVQLDASNAAQGYVMVKYAGKNPKIKIQITKGKGATYTYNLNARSAYEVFPLSYGDGNYAIKVFENISGTKYS